jgi:hypothetical protein
MPIKNPMAFFTGQEINKPKFHVDVQKDPKLSKKSRAKKAMPLISR